jgi:hypothetical protein
MEDHPRPAEGCDPSHPLPHLIVIAWMMADAARGLDDVVWTSVYAHHGVLEELVAFLTQAVATVLLAAIHADHALYGALPLGDVLLGALRHGRLQGQ